MGKQLLGVILAVLASASLQGQSVKPADLAGDWILALEQFGETDYHRMTWQVVGDRVTVASDGVKLEGRIHDGTFELQQPGKDGPPMRMTGTVEHGGMSGDFTRGSRTGRWKATRIPVRSPNAPESTCLSRKSSTGCFPGRFHPSCTFIRETR